MTDKHNSKVEFDKTGPNILGIAVSSVLVIGIVVVVFVLITALGLRGIQTRVEASSKEGGQILKDTELRTALILNDGCYAVLDAEAGIYRIPIERAMELEARQPWRIAAAQKWALEPAAAPNPAEDATTTQ